MASSRALVLLFLLVVAATAVSAAPWFDFGFSGNRNRPYTPNRGRSGRDRYRSICRTINADNYAFPGRVPYPSAPLCPY